MTTPTCNFRKYQITFVSLFSLVFYIFQNKIVYHVSVWLFTTLTQCPFRGSLSQRLLGYKFFSNIFLKTKNFAQPILPVNISRGGVFLYIKKWRKSRDTVPLIKAKYRYLVILFMPKLRQGSLLSNVLLYKIINNLTF